MGGWVDEVAWEIPEGVRKSFGKWGVAGARGYRPTAQKSRKHSLDSQKVCESCEVDSVTL